MASYLYRLGRFCAERAWFVVIAWVMLLVAGVTGATTLGKPFTSTMSIPGTEFQRVLDDLKTSLPSAAGGLGTVVITTQDGAPFAEDQRQAVAQVVQDWTALEGVDLAIDPFQTQQQLDAAAEQVSGGRAQLQQASATLTAQQEQLDAQRAQLEQAGAAAPPQALAQVEQGQQQLDAALAQLEAQTAELDQGERRIALTEGLRTVSQDNTAAVAQIRFDEPLNSVPQDTLDAVVETGDPLADAGVQIDYSADIVQDLNVIGPGEAVGVLIAGVVLLVMLGSLLAAGLPLLTALIGVAVGLLGAVTLTHWFEMTDVTPTLALMLGLAVGIDYALFLVNRHREQLVQGLPMRQSIGRATGTAGSAVLFAGLTVIVALAALSITGIPFLATMGYVAAGTVAVAVLVSITLTPALLSLIGQRVLSSRARRELADRLTAEHAQAEAEDAEADADQSDPRPRGRGWAGLVTRRPLLTIVVATIGLAIMAIPAASLRLGLPDGAYEPRDSTAYRTYSTIGERFGPGQNGPIIAVAKLDGERAGGLDETALTDLELTLAEKLAEVDGVTYVVPIGQSSDKQTLAFQLVPATGPSEDETADLVNRLRETSANLIDDAATQPGGQSDDQSAGQAGVDAVTSIGFTGQTVANIDISEALGESLPSYLAVVVGISLILLLLVFRSVVVPVLATVGFLLTIGAAFGAVVAVYQWGWLASLFGVEQTGLVLSFLPTLVIGILFGLAMDYQMFLVSGMREAWAHGHTARTAVHTGFAHGARVVTAAALIMTSVFASFIHAELTMVRPIGFALAIGVLIDAFIVRMTVMPAMMYLLGERAWYLPQWLSWLPDLDIEGTKLQIESDQSKPQANEPAEVS